jgi:hypothetical protein
VREKSKLSLLSIDYWAAKSVQDQPDQRALMEGHAARARLRFLLFVAALMIIGIFSLALEYGRHLTGGASFSPWRCLGGMLPGLLGLIAMLSVSAAFVRDVYDISNWYSALSHVWMLLFGRVPFSLFDLPQRALERLLSVLGLSPSAPRLVVPYPSLIVQKGQIGEEYEDTPLARLGGPGNAIVFDDSAVILERFGRFIRVAGPGAVFLRRFARPSASLFPPAPGTPGPVYKWAWTQAGQCHAWLIDLDTGRQRENHWSEQVMGNVGSTMRAIIANYRLDELLEPYEPDRDPRREIAQRLHRGLDAATRDFGAQVLEVRMGTLEPTLEEVARQRMATWQAIWKSEARKEKARGEAEAIRERGLARAYAQMEIIIALTREFQEVVEQDTTLSAEFIALRFIEALRQVWIRPGGTLIPFEALRTLDYLQRIVRRDYALPGGEGGSE